MSHRTMHSEFGMTPSATRLSRIVVYTFCLAGAISFFSSCYGGLNPADYAQKAVLSGRVHFLRGAGASNYPPLDSLFDLRVVAFKEIPRDTNIVGVIANGEAFFSSSLVDSTFPVIKDFQLEIPQNQLADSSVLIRYLAVGQQYGPNVFSDWHVVGVYSIDSMFTPVSLRVLPGMVRTDIDLDVDFKKLPPQPFKR